MNILLNEADRVLLLPSRQLRARKSHWRFVRVVVGGQPVGDHLERWVEADTPMAEALAISGESNMLPLMERVMPRRGKNLNA